MKDVFSEMAKVDVTCLKPIPYIRRALLYRLGDPFLLEQAVHKCGHRRQAIAVELRFVVLNVYAINFSARIELCQCVSASQ